MTRSAATVQPNRKDDIALIAFEIFVEKGYLGTSMSEVARAAGVRKPTLYHHFASKEELFLAALAADVAAPLSAIAQLLDRGDGAPDARFRTALGLFYDAMLGSKIGSMATTVCETSREMPVVAEGFHESYIKRFDDLLYRAYAPCVAAGTHRDVGAVTIQQIVFGSLLTMTLTENMFASVPHVLARWRSGRTRAEFVDMIDDLFRKDRPG